MKKRIILIVCLCAICLFTVWNFSTVTHKVTGTMTEAEKTETANGIIQYKRYNTLLNFKKLSGTISIYKDDTLEKYATEYEIMGTVFKAEKCWSVTVTRYSSESNQYVFGMLYFDKDMQNIILSTDEMEFTAADAIFIENVNEYRQITE